MTNTSTLAPSRISTIDLLKGIAMLVMALDHVRDFFHADAFLFEPTDIDKTNFLLFFTRFVTNICAPAFCLLAGTSAFFVGRRKTKTALTQFLLARGAWLVFMEMTIMTFGWYFDPSFHVVSFGVIGALGCAMLCLSVLVYLPLRALFLLGFALIFAHNLLDPIHQPNAILWSLLHEAQTLTIGAYKLDIYYPILPWIGIMAVGYCMGVLYEPDFSALRRKTLLRNAGWILLILFLALRTYNGYGDPAAWQYYPTLDKTVCSFFNLQKYPPSLDFLLLTVGMVFIFLAYSEQWRGKFVDICCTYGRVPFFYYILHLYLIHALAAIIAGVSGAGWGLFVLYAWEPAVPELHGYGFGLGVVYAVWLAVIIALYPLCKRYDAYKTKRKDLWFLSYL